MNNQQLSLAEKFWNEIQFEGKEFTRVEQNNILFSPGNHWPEKVLVEWNLHTNVDDFSPFITKYQVWKEECNQHLTALENQPNLKLLSRIEHLIQQGLEEKMIGDIHPLMSALEQGRQELNQLHQIRLIDIEQILQNLESINLQEDWSQETLNEAHELIEQWEIKTNYQHAQLAQYHTRWNNFRIKFNQRKAYFLEKRNIERMNNMDLKMQICEEAEDIMNSEDWKTTSSTMEELLDRWKQIGMAPTYEKNEELWERFRAARNHFFDRRKAFQELQKEEEEKNLALKLALVEESETLNGPPWKKNDERHQEIMKEWKTIGKIPYDQIETLWNRLQQSRDVFYEARRENAKAFRMELEKNYEIKKQLADQAEELKNSTDWRTATEQFNQLMDQWKNTGRLSKEHGDELWEQFIQARRHFFDRKDQHRQQIQEKQQERVAQRKAQLSQEIKDLEWVINDEKSKITEFKESLERIQDNSPKDVALKKHLNDLIAEIEQKLPKKEQLLHELKSKSSINSGK